MTAIPNGVENEYSSSLDQETETVTVNGSRGSCDSSSSIVETTKPDDVVTLIKEEDDAVNFNDSPSVDFPKPVMGLNEMGPTPFLRKTFEIVDDAVTDPVISWSPTRKSFIIWDSYEFSENLLPKYFKHNNFSSFVRQLNTYGFRKVDSDRWEFANEGFQGGKKHLLKNIKRRSKSNRNKDVSTTTLKTETEVETLKKDQCPMNLEILKLKQQQEESDHQIVTVQEKIHGVESKQQYMLSFFAKLAKDERFVERLVKKRKMKLQRELEAAKFVKMLELLQDQETGENLPDVESNLIAMASTQPNSKLDILTNNESGNTRCQLNTEELVVDETGITFASLYPGCIATTGLFREHIPLFRTLFFPPFQKYITKGYVSETEAGKRLAQVASDPSLTKSGVYWSWNKSSASFENQLSQEASGMEKARRVWEVSEKLVGLA